MSRPGYMKQVDEQAFWEWISWHPGYNVPDRSRRIRVSQETPGWNIRAVIAWACGAIVTFAVPDSWIPDISAMIVSGGVYYLLTMNTESVTNRRLTQAASR